LVVDAVESVKTILIASGLSFIIGCVLGYLYLIPFFIPPVVFIASMRNTMMNVLIAALIMSGVGGETLKVSAVTFLITVFFTSSLVQLMDDMDRDEYDHAVTMRMSAWQILWHRVIRFRMYFVYMAFIPCVAMGYSTLSVVEGVVRTFGGLGDLMLQVDKISSYEGILAIAIVSGLLGFSLWLTLWTAGRAYFKWATRTTVKS
jgi:NitT/TauT family transport system permease protein